MGYTTKENETFIPISGGRFPIFGMTIGIVIGWQPYVTRAEVLFANCVAELSAF
uniref:Uncharacterized protein n=1 Tax=Magallana gigas TaxID=29159 RepID=K1QRH1_MAGGI